MTSSFWDEDAIIEKPQTQTTQSSSFWGDDAIVDNGQMQQNSVTPNDIQQETNPQVASAPVNNGWANIANNISNATAGLRTDPVGTIVNSGKEILGGFVDQVAQNTKNTWNNGLGSVPGNLGSFYQGAVDVIPELINGGVKAANTLINDYNGTKPSQYWNMPSADKYTEENIVQMFKDVSEGKANPITTAWNLVPKNTEEIARFGAALSGQERDKKIADIFAEHKEQYPLANFAGAMVAPMGIVFGGASKASKVSRLNNAVDKAEKLGKADKAKILRQQAKLASAKEGAKSFGKSVGLGGMFGTMGDYENTSELLQGIGNQALAGGIIHTGVGGAKYVGKKVAPHLQEASYKILPKEVQENVKKHIDDYRKTGKLIEKQNARTQDLLTEEDVSYLRNLNLSEKEIKKLNDALTKGVVFDKTEYDNTLNALNELRNGKKKSTTTKSKEEADKWFEEAEKREEQKKQSTEEAFADDMKRMNEAWEKQQAQAKPESTMEFVSEELTPEEKANMVEVPEQPSSKSDLSPVKSETDINTPNDIKTPQNEPSKRPQKKKTKKGKQKLQDNQYVDENGNVITKLEPGEAQGSGDLYKLTNDKSEDIYKDVEKEPSNNRTSDMDEAHRHKLEQFNKKYELREVVDTFTNKDGETIQKPSKYIIINKSTGKEITPQQRKALQRYFREYKERDLTQDERARAEREEAIEDDEYYDKYDKANTLNPIEDENIGKTEYKVNPEEDAEFMKWYNRFSKSTEGAKAKMLSDKVRSFKTREEANDFIQKYSEQEERVNSGKRARKIGDESYDEADVSETERLTEAFKEEGKLTKDKKLDYEREEVKEDEIPEVNEYERQANEWETNREKSGKALIDGYEEVKEYKDKKTGEKYTTKGWKGGLAKGRFKSFKERFNYMAKMNHRNNAKMQEFYDEAAGKILRKGNNPVAREEALKLLNEMADEAMSRDSELKINKREYNAKEAIDNAIKKINELTEKGELAKARKLAGEFGFNKVEKTKYLSKDKQNTINDLYDKSAAEFYQKAKEMGITIKVENGGVERTNLDLSQARKWCYDWVDKNVKDSTKAGQEKYKFRKYDDKVEKFVKANYAKLFDRYKNIVKVDVLKTYGGNEQYAIKEQSVKGTENRYKAEATGDVKNRDSSNVDEAKNKANARTEALSKIDGEDVHEVDKGTKTIGEYSKQLAAEGKVKSYKPLHEFIKGINLCKFAKNMFYWHKDAGITEVKKGTLPDKSAYRNKSDEVLIEEGLDDYEKISRLAHEFGHREIRNAIRDGGRKAVDIAYGVFNEIFPPEQAVAKLREALHNNIKANDKYTNEKTKLDNKYSKKFVDDTIEECLSLIKNGKSTRGLITDKRKIWNVIKNNLPDTPIENYCNRIENEVLDGQRKLGRQISSQHKQLEQNKISNSQGKGNRSTEQSKGKMESSDRTSERSVQEKEILEAIEKDDKKKVVELARKEFGKTFTPTEAAEKLKEKLGVKDDTVEFEFSNKYDANGNVENSGLQFSTRRFKENPIGYYESLSDKHKKAINKVLGKKVAEVFGKAVDLSKSTEEILTDKLKVLNDNRRFNELVNEYASSVFDKDIADLTAKEKAIAKTNVEAMMLTEAAHENLYTKIFAEPNKQELSFFGKDKQDALLGTKQGKVKKIETLEDAKKVFAGMMARHRRYEALSNTIDFVVEHFGKPLELTDRFDIKERAYYEPVNLDLLKLTMFKRGSKKFYQTLKNGKEAIKKAFKGEDIMDELLALHNQASTPNIMLPRHIINALLDNSGESLAVRGKRYGWGEVAKGSVGTLLDIRNHFFKRRVLGLSPKWFINNRIGNALMMAKDYDNPLEFVQDMVRAIKVTEKDLPMGVLDSNILDAVETFKTVQTFTGYKPIDDTLNILSGKKYSIDELKQHKANIEKQISHIKTKISNKDELVKQLKEVDSAITKANAINFFTKPLRFTQKAIDLGYKINDVFEQHERKMLYLNRARKAYKEQLADKSEVQRVATNMLRQTELLEWANNNPKVKELIKQQMLDTLGDYNNLTNVERGLCRRVFPFYKWMKVITKNTYKFIKEQPEKAAIMLYQLKRLADSNADKADWQKYSIDLGNGNVLNLEKMIPYNTFSEMADGVMNLVNPSIREGYEGLVKGRKSFADQQIKNSRYSDDNYYLKDFQRDKWVKQRRLFDNKNQDFVMDENGEYKNSLPLSTRLGYMGTQVANDLFPMMDNNLVSLPEIGSAISNKKHGRGFIPKQGKYDVGWDRYNDGDRVDTRYLKKDSSRADDRKVTEYDMKDYLLRKVLPIQKAIYKNPDRMTQEEKEKYYKAIEKAQKAKKGKLYW